MKSNAEQTIDICLKTTKLTEEILKSALNDFLKNKTKKLGNIKLEKLAERYGKLESIEITENNIKSFLSVAQKYDIDFALKRDSSTVPPIYHCFFATNKAENFQKAFREYAAKTSKTKEFSISRESIKEKSEKIKEQANERSAQRDKNKTRQKSKSEMR